MSANLTAALLFSEVLSDLVMEILQLWRASLPSLVQLKLQLCSFLITTSSNSGPTEFARSKGNPGEIWIIEINFCIFQDFLANQILHHMILLYSFICKNIVHWKGFNLEQKSNMLYLFLDVEGKEGK